MCLQQSVNKGNLASALAPDMRNAEADAPATQLGGSTELLRSCCTYGGIGRIGSESAVSSLLTADVCTACASAVSAHVLSVQTPCAHVRTYVSAAWCLGMYGARKQQQYLPLPKLSQPRS